MNSDKTHLREEAARRRNGLNPASENIQQVGHLFRTEVNPAKEQIIALYWPTARELDIRYLIRDLAAGGYAVALPVPSRDDKVMKFSLWDGKAELVRGDFGVFIPPALKYVEPDIIITPLLAFDHNGYRLGRGGGHYDATLAHLRASKNILAIGVGYAQQAVLFNLPVEEHDQKMDLIITPAGVHDFR